MNAKCPFLEELLVAYCSACPVKKMIAKDQLISQNPCEADYASCPIFKEFLAKQTKEAKMADIEKNEMNSGEGEKPCIWMKAGVIAYRMCTKNYDCKNCEFDQALLDQSGAYTESPMVVKAIERLRQLPASERKCRYMLTGDFSYKICSNNYECWHCAVDQYVQDTIEADPYLQKRRQRLTKKEKKVKGFTIREDFYYLPNHIWIKVEGEVVKIGIDDFAARLIGKMENVELPDKNVISKDDACWRLGSHNRMVRMTLPTDTEVIEKNDLVQSDPTIIQKEPYGRGWLLKIKSPAGVGNMLKGSQAIDWLEKEFEKLHQEFETHVGITITDGGEIVDNIHERLTNEEWNRLVTRFLS
jgi:glycine cleavage system H lipoate-binding protein